MAGGVACHAPESRDPLIPVSATSQVPLSVLYMELLLPHLHMEDITTSLPTSEG